MAVPSVRDEAATAGALSGLLRQALSLRDVAVTVLPSSRSTGFSSESVLFDATATYLGAVGDVDWTAGWTAYPL